MTQTEIIQYARELVAASNRSVGRNLIPFVPVFSEEVAGLIATLADDLEEAQAAYRRLTEAACREIEGQRDHKYDEEAA